LSRAETSINSSATDVHVHCQQPIEPEHAEEVAWHRYCCLLNDPDVVKVEWFDLTGSFLIKHLAFFFVPITVGLMNSGPLLLAHGVGIMLVLTVSAAIGFLLTGFVSQTLLIRPWRQGEGS
jgi:hypothetical protein